jgi:hypothetical protein
LDACSDRIIISGIVPCKTRVMSETMVNMVTTQLLNIEEVFRRLDPDAVAEILSPEVPKLMHSIGSDMSPVGWLPRISKSLFFALPMKAISTMSTMNHKFLHDFTVAMQDNIGALLNVKNCVVNKMMEQYSSVDFEAGFGKKPIAIFTFDQDFALFNDSNIDMVIHYLEERRDSFVGKRFYRSQKKFNTKNKTLG